MLVYKFLDDEYGLKNLAGQHLKISTLEDLNDPFELLPYNVKDRNLRRTLQRTRQEIAQNRGILCFSADWRDPVVWAHYARKHFGFCFAFDVPDEACRRIRYITERLAFPKVPAKEDAEALIFTKYKNWRYEQEVRMWAALNEREDGLYFLNFGEQLRLVKVIAGARCVVSGREIKSALGSLADSVKLVKARAGFTKFEIVKDERGFVR